MHPESPSVDTPQDPLSAAGRHHRRFLPYVSVLALTLLTLGLVLTLDDVSLPDAALRLASAVETKPETVKSPSPPAAEKPQTISAGDIPLLQSLQERQARLEAKEQQLAKREKELDELQQHLEKKLATLTMLRKEIGALIEEKEAFDAQRFAHLVKVYEGMKPAEAASLVERLNEETAVKLFYRMKEKKVSQILGFIKPEIAAKLSERLIALQHKPQQTSLHKEHP